jgi:hypothetical protein
MKKIIHLKIANIQKAKEEAFARIPAGFRVLSEEIHYEGIKQYAKVRAFTSEEAQQAVDPHMAVTDVNVVQEAQLHSEKLSARDLAAANAAASSLARKLYKRAGVVKSVKYSSIGPKGLFGSNGKNLYNVVVGRPGQFELGYARSAIFEVTLTNRESEPDFPLMRSTVDIPGLSRLLYDPEFEIRAEAFRSLNSLLSTTQIGPENKEAIMISLRKAAPQLGDEFLTSLVNEDWNKWIAVSYLAESDDPSTLATLLRHLNDISPYAEIICKLLYRFGTDCLKPEDLQRLEDNMTVTALYVGSMPHEALGSTQILIALNTPGLTQTLEKIKVKKDYQNNGDGNEISYSYEEQRKLARAALKKIRAASMAAVPFQEM